jgi:hypothetical protein
MQIQETCVHRRAAKDAGRIYFLLLSAETPESKRNVTPRRLFLKSMDNPHDPVLHECGIEVQQQAQFQA